MFTYADAHGRVYDVTGKDGHFYEHLTCGDKVTVLVAPDGSDARLGDFESLYGAAILRCVIGLCFLALIQYGMRAADRYLGLPAPTAETPYVYTGSTGSQPRPADAPSSHILSFLQEIGQSHLPVSDLAIYLGGFLLISGAVLAFTLSITVKRQDPALINALQQQNYAAALSLATQGRGVEGKTAEGETALILALKVNQPDVARAILNCRFVNANVYTIDTKSSAQLAAANGDLQTLLLLLQKGAPAFDLEPGLIHALIVKGDAASLRLIFDNGFNLEQEYRQLSFGDYAVIEGQAEIVRLIQAHNGLFRAPAAFIALALNDSIALQAALKRPDEANRTFYGYSLEQFAQKIGRQALLATMRSDG
jgi:hypothetical protein